MPATEIAEHTPQRLELKSGSTTLTFDKGSGKARFRRKLLFWNMKPVEASLSDIAQVTVDTAVDRASGVEICHTMVVLRKGTGWAFPAADKQDAEANGSLIRKFVGLRA